MTKKMKKILEVLLCGVFVFCTAAFAVGCGSSYETADYVYNDPYKTELDEGVVLDGVLSESFWKTNKSLTRGIVGMDINVTMNAFLGEKGVYMSFEVNDYDVYFNETRATYLNTGIELYVSSPSGENSLIGNAYEVDFNAGGKVGVRKRSTSGYQYVSIRAKQGVVVDGEINTSTCKGYTIEAFMPYEMFGGKVDFVYVMPAIIRSNSNMGSDRLWYNLLTENDGADSAYYSAKNWYKFDAKGVMAYFVNVEKTGSGTGDVKATELLLPGKAFDLNVVPDVGSYVSSVKINGREVLGSMKLTFDGAVYKDNNAAEDMNVVVEFKKIPVGNSNFNLNLQLNKFGERTAAKGAKVIVKDGNGKIVLNSTVGDDGIIQAGSQPNGAYYITCSCDGYITEEETCYLIADTVYEKELQYAIFKNENAEYDISRANDGIIKATKNACTDLVFTDQSEDFYLEFKLKAGEDVTNDARFYLKFYDKKGGHYGVRTMEKYNTSSLDGIAFCGFGESDYISWQNYSFNAAQLNAMYGDGLKLAFARASGKLYVYVYNYDTDEYVTALSKFVGKDDVYSLSKYMPYEITEIKYRTAEAFDIFVENHLSVWNYDAAGNVEFTGNTGLLQFKEQVEDFSLEFRYKMTTDTAAEKDARFYLRFDDKNGHYGVRIMENDNQPTNISFATWGGANIGWKSYTFNSAQKQAIKGNGLKIKITRINGVIKVYVENVSTGETELKLTSTAEIGKGDIVSLAGWQPYKLSGLNYNTKLN